MQPTEADIDEDDDEETLQLKLQELQARLKLKKLQNARAKEPGSSLRSQTAGRPQPVTTERKSFARSTAPSGEENRRPRSENIIQIPASPVKKTRPPDEHTSPRRVQLGIDKGLKAKDVSLKRAPSLRKVKGVEGSQHEGYLRRTRTPNPTDNPAPSRPLSFSERLASVKTDEASNAERQKRIQQSRTKAFGLGKEEMEQYRNSAVDIPEEALKPPVFSRDEVLSKDWRGSGGLRRSNTAPSIRSPRKEGKSDSGEAESSSQTDGEGSFEPYSTIHLTRRNLPHTVLARQVSGKRIMNIKDVMREVRAPDFSLPDVEQDVVIFGIVAKKSDPRSHKPGTANGKKNEDRGKYMVMSLCDLDYEVDLFLFNSGFDRFWKLTEGTVVAILNPNVMPPPPGRQDTGRFSLVINSDEDTIIEIGISRDLGYCQSVKKDGDSCGTWVNKKRTGYCEYHTNEAVRKTKASRVELNDAGFGYGPKSKGDKSRSKKGFDSDFKKKGPKNYDWETKTRWFASRSMSAADLIDGKDQTTEDRKERQAHLQRSLEAKEKEREMMRKLGQFGDAAGREYMKYSGSKAGNTSRSSIASSKAGTSADGDAQKKSTLASLNLQGKERSIHLSPIKRKRPISSQNGLTTGKSSALGWGGGLRDKLARMKDGEKLRKEMPESQPPVQKKTRFVTEKGIREAGRESLGVDLTDRQLSFDDDDDDELVIVK